MSETERFVLEEREREDREREREGFIRFKRDLFLRGHIERAIWEGKRCDCWYKVFLREPFGNGRGNVTVGKVSLRDPFGN